MTIVWDDGEWAVIEGKDWRPGLARSKTNDTLADAVKSNSWDPSMANVPIGPKSLNKLIKVKLVELKQAVARLQVTALRPSNFGGSSTKKSIPDYPHTCLVCGGKTLILFSSTEHEGGVCPGPKKRLRV